MPITKQNVASHELIGLEAEVVMSSDPGLVGVRGVVVDETHGMLVIEQKGRLKAVPKSTSIFELILPNREKVKIDGVRLLGRPEDRIKKRG